METTAVQLAGLRLRSPVILAAGTAGYCDELSDALDVSRVGAVVSKSITPLPREGNATCRILDARAGMLNAIGLANVGLDRFLEHVAPRLAHAPAPVIGSAAGFSIDDYVRVAGAMDDIDALAGIELNVSCPNVHGGTEFGADPGALRELVAAVRAVVSRRPLLVKLSPVAVAPAGAGIIDLARAAISPTDRSRGVDALSISNTIPAMAIDLRTRRPRLSNVTGGLSGPALHPVALKLVFEVHRRVAREAGVPLIGVGGVMTWRDAAEFILAGAAAVQMGTALFADPRAPRRVDKGLARWVQRQGKRSIAELVGAVEIE